MNNLLAWLATYLLHSSIFLFGAYAITRFMGQNQLQLQNTLWKTAVFAGLITAGLQTSGVVTSLYGSLSLPLIDQQARPAQGEIYTRSYSAVQFSHITSGSRQIYIQQSNQFSRPMPTSPSRDSGGYGYFILLFWLIGMIFGTIRLMLYQLRLRRLPRKPVADFAVLSAFQTILNSANVKRNIRLSQSKAISGPIVLSGSEICLPDKVIGEMNTHQQRSVLAHELSHIIRRDTFWFLALAILEAILFFQPLNRLARRHIRTLTEYSCDDWAIGKTGRSIDLAHCLANVASWTTTRPPASHVPAMAAGALKKRVSRILDGSISRSNLPVYASLAIVTVLTLLLCFTAPMFSASPATKNAAYQISSVTSISQVNFFRGEVFQRQSEERLFIYVPQREVKASVKKPYIIWH